MKRDENGNLDVDLECPYCYYRGGKLTQGTTGKRKVPAEGDPSMCVKCGEVSIFDSRLNLRTSCDDDWTRFDASLIKALADAKKMWEHLFKPMNLNRTPDHGKRS